MESGLNAILSQINQGGQNMLNAYQIKQSERQSELTRQIMQQRMDQESEQFKMQKAMHEARSLDKVLNANSQEESDLMADISGVNRVLWRGPDVAVTISTGHKISGPRKHVQDFMKIVSSGDSAGAKAFADDMGLFIEPPEQQKMATNMEAALLQARQNGDVQAQNEIMKLMGEMKAMESQYKQNNPADPYFTAVPTSSGYFTLNARNGQYQPMTFGGGNQLMPPQPNQMPQGAPQPLLPVPADTGLAGRKKTAEADAELQIERKKVYPKIKGSMTSLNNQWDLVEKQIDKAIGMVGPFTTGVGAWVSIIPATPQKNLSANLDTIRANVGFDKLQDMRTNSPTGGALGQVSEQENKLLQSVQGSLDQSQSPAQLRDNLMTIKEQLRLVRQQKNEAFKTDFMDFQAASNDPPVSGAKKAPDGKWYVEKNGKFYVVEE